MHMKKQKIILASIVSAMVVVAAASGLICLSRGNGPVRLQHDASTGASVSLSTEDAREPSTTTGETDAGTQPSQKPETEPSAAPTEKPTASEQKPEPTTKPGTGVTSPTATKPPAIDSTEETTGKVVVVGHADPKTGISWDGKSPIIYTYPDGSTGTVPKDGATYESLPGTITTYKIPRDSAGREIGSTCNECGKEVQKASKGKYCTQFAKDTICEFCGVRAPAHTCHLCENYKQGVYYCHKCGRVSGSDGSDGKCVRWMAGEKHTCPSCKETVLVNTCHTCGEN